MTNTFFISDTHFSHRNIIQYCGRPYSSIEEMNEALIYNWNFLVKPNDTVYHLGDISFADVETTRDILSRLNGNKILIAGNHDRHGHSKWARKDPMLVWDFFKEVHDYRRIKVGGKRIVLCHFPLESWERGYFHFHGHTHGKVKGLKGRLDVGVDNPAACYAPVLFEDACKLALDNTVESEYK